MTNKSLIKEELITALKELGIVTKDDLQRQLKAMEDRQDKKHASKQDLDEKLGRLERRLKRNDNKNKREIMHTIAKLALSTSTLQAFEKLKEKVEQQLVIS